MSELRDKLTKLQLPPAVRKEVDREMARLKRTPREGMEVQVIRTYLETIAELPWNERSAESPSLHTDHKPANANAGADDDVM